MKVKIEKKLEHFADNRLLNDMVSLLSINMLKSPSCFKRKYVMFHENVRKPCFIDDFFLYVS